MVAHTCNLSTEEAEAGRVMFEAILGYIGILCLKELRKKKKRS
jgi:hypothetical protein